MAAQLSASPYLSALAERFPLSESCADIEAQLNHTESADLPHLKAKFALAFARHDFEDFDEMGRIWTRFADITIDRALELAWQETAIKHRLKIPKTGVPGLFILGLGKLGGLDLNFSSDVDLIAFYDAETLPVPASKGQAYIASDVCKRLTQILQPRHAPDFVWRVDWRLRPESSGTGLAISTDKAETFYFFRALAWHRLALMKARTVAGDIQAGQKFLSDLEPFIWRRNLDFTMIDELSALKSRINDEHPGLEGERTAPAPITEKAEGFNLKLGRGGIREIEFIANAQQLVHGGKRPDLRVTNTRAALTALAKEGLITPENEERLKADYAYFRRVENAVQMYQNEQTHIVPDTLSHLSDLEEFDAQIFKRRHRTHESFAALFTETKSSAASIDISGLEGQPKTIAKHWAEGFTDHGLNASVSTNFVELGQSLIKRVQRQNRPNAFQTIDDFLKQLGRSEQYFALLHRHPDLLDTLITPLLHSPHMTKILKQSPHIIDIFLTRDASSLDAQSAFVLSSPDYERRLEALRRFVNEQLYRAYTHFLRGQISVQRLQSQLTKIAEQTLTLSIKIVAHDLGVKDLPITVLGLGNMGRATMAPQSDLDLIFLFADDCDPNLSAKAVRRLRTTLMTKLREGIAYELDMRLRPSGRSGPPAVKLSAFRDHHMNRAHSWEHIALAPARIVAGDAELGEQVMSVKSEILERPRHRLSFLADAKSMYGRILTERIEDTPTDIWRCKLRNGGLMQADFLLSCFDVMGETPPKNMAEASQEWKELQIWERLLGLKDKPVSETPTRFAERIPVSSLTDRVQTLEQLIQTSAVNLFSEVKTDNLPNPAPIIWA